MKLRNEFITYDNEGTQILVSVDSKLFSGLAQGNRTAAFLIDLLKQETDEEQLTAALLERYEVDRATAAADVHRIVEQLRSIRALDE